MAFFVYIIYTIYVYFCVDSYLISNGQVKSAQSNARHLFYLPSAIEIKLVTATMNERTKMSAYTFWKTMHCIAWHGMALYGNVNRESEMENMTSERNAKDTIDRTHYLLE